jgi:hypothetical protein
MTKSLGEVKSLPPLAREVAILVTAGHEQAAYAIYAHKAASKLGENDLQQILGGSCPPHLDAACQVSFRVAKELSESPGPLKLEVWEGAVKVLGLEAAKAVVHYVGFYKYISTILNGFDAKLPDQP